MKKITLMMFAMMFSFVGFSQIVLTQSIDPVTVDDGGVACWSNTTGEYRENSFLRSYDLADFGVTGNFLISSVEYGQGSADEGKIVNLNIYTADNVDLTVANLTFVATAMHQSTAAEDLTLISEDLSAVIPAGSIIVFEVNAGDSGTNTGETYFQGNNGAGENAVSYLMAEGCGITTPTPVGDIAAPESYVMNVVGSEIVSVGDNLAEVISIYPNPATSVLNINLPSNIQVESSSLVDVLGRTTGVVYSNGEMNVSGLAAGVYFLNLKTNFGSYTQKIVKQ